MEITTARFGKQEADPQKTIFFPKGIVGFEGNKKFQLFHECKEDHMVYYLQSLDNPALTLNTIVAEQFGMKYEFDLCETYMDDLKSKDNEALVALCVISKTDSDDHINVHPECPILLDTITQRGIQLKAGEIKMETDKQVNKAA